MIKASILSVLVDKGGKRSGIDRRQFTYTDHVPDRRYKKVRRSGHDRRNVVEQRSGNDRRINNFIESKYEEMRRGLDRRCSIDRRVAYAAVSVK